MQTGPELSISLAITFRSKASDMWTDAHAFNHHVRRLGWRPSPVRKSDAVDGLKATAFRAARQVRGALRKLKG